MGVEVKYTNKDFFIEFRALSEFFSKSPEVLSNRTFISDQFLLFKDFLVANPDNITAKILFEDSKQLYRVFGSKASAYVSFIKLLSTIFLSGETDTLVIKEKLDSFYKRISTDIVHFDSFAEFEALGFNLKVLEAIARADGGFLDIELDSFSYEDYISEGEGFTFDVVPRADFNMTDASVIVLDKQITASSLAKLLESINPPYLVICLGHSDDLTKFGELNDSPAFHLVEARIDYNEKEFTSDLKHYVNQSEAISIRNLKADSCGTATFIKCSGSELRLVTYKSYSRILYTKGLMQQEVKSTSPLIQQTLQKRIHNLAGTSTVINIGVRSNIDALKKQEDYMTQILEVSNILTSGVVIKNSISEEFNNLSFYCFKECLTKAMRGLFYAMSETRVIQK